MTFADLMNKWGYRGVNLAWRRWRLFLWYKWSAWAIGFELSPAVAVTLYIGPCAITFGYDFSASQYASFDRIWTSQQ